MSRFNMRSMACLGAASLGLALAQPARAANPQADVTVSGLTFTLIDLDPGDGITPSMTFKSEAMTWMPTAIKYQSWVRTVLPADTATRAWSVPDQATLIYAQQYYSPVQLATGGVAASEQASIGGTGDAAGVVLSASSMSLAVADMSSAEAVLMGGGYIYNPFGNFVLSPHTALEVTIHATGSASVDARAIAGGYQAAGAMAQLVLESQDASGSWHANPDPLSGLAAADAGCTAQAAPIPAYANLDLLNCAAPAMTFDELLTQTISNPSGVATLGHLGVYSGAFTTELAELPTVPEPAGAAAWLAGAALLARLLARARGRAREPDSHTR